MNQLNALFTKPQTTNNIVPISFSGLVSKPANEMAQEARCRDGSREEEARTIERRRRQQRRVQRGKRVRRRRRKSQLSRPLVARLAINF